MAFLQACVRNPVAVAVGVLLVALFGLIAAFHMPVQLTPEVQVPTLTIETRWPGASAQEVEREIVQEQEEQLKSVEGVTKMSSESMDSLGRISLEFAVGANMSETLLKVNTKLQQVKQYPVDADEPVINTSDASDRPIAWFILRPHAAGPDEIAAFQDEHPDLTDALEPVRRARSSGLRLKRLRELAAAHPELEPLLPPDLIVSRMRKFAEDVIEARFERVPGVSNSNVMGGEEEELQVVVDPERLAARQLTIGDIRRALRGQNKDTSGGDFWEGKRRYIVRTLGQFRSPEQVAGVIVARQNDAPVYLRDVAEVRLGYKKPDGFVRNLGMQCIAVNCLRETGANVLDVMAGLRQAAGELNAGVLRPRGLEIELVYDETDYIYSSIGMVQSNMVVGGLLTIATLLVFLRSGRSTLILGLAIPISIVGTFLMLNLLGRSLNVISLAGMAFAVGMLVDNSIVVLENIYRHRQLGKPALAAAIYGTKEVWLAVLNSTATTLAVFLPVLFVEEEAGQLFRDIALAISFSVGLSLVVSVTLIPTTAARILRGRAAAPDGRPPRRRGRAATLIAEFRAVVHHIFGLPLDAFGSGFLSLVIGINRLLQRSMLLRLASSVVLVGTSVVLSYLMLPKVEYLPAGNRNLVLGILLPPPGYNLQQLSAMGQEVEVSLRPYWDLDPASAEAAKLPFPVIGDLFYIARGRNLFMGMRSTDPLRAGELVPLVQRVVAELPGTFVVAKQSSLFERGLTAGRTVDIEITGPDITKLVALGGRVLGQVPTVVPGSQALPRPSLDLSNPEVHVLPKWEQAADLGIDSTDLGYTVDALVDGAYATDYFVGGDKIDLTIMGRHQLASHTQDLAALPVSTPTGKLVPLAALADVRLASGPEQINRRERQRAITISVTPPREIALEDAIDRISGQIVEPLVQSGELSGEYQINLSGTSDKLRSTWLALRFNLLLAVLITYLLMAALFGSWLYPFVVILSVPLGAVGGFAGLWILNQFVLQPLDMLTMLGFVILVGTVVNNPILIVEQTLVHMRDEGLPRREAILESVKNRIRPIFMTTLTTVFGLLPLVVSPGAGSELYRGLGAVLLGGLLFSTLFTLILVPTVLRLMLDAKDALLRFFGHGPAARPPLPSEKPERAAAALA